MEFPKLFKTTVMGLGPFCVEFADGEIITTRTEERQRQIATAPALYDALKAVLVMWDRGPSPRKLDEALGWRENDIRAREMANAAIAKWEGRTPERGE